MNRIGNRRIRRAAGKVARLGAFLLAMAAVPCRGAGDPPPAFREYDVKAVFLYNFAQFVEWPESVSTNGVAPFTIGVLGEDPFGKILDETVKGEHVKGRPLAVRRFRTIEEVKDCQLLFVSRSEKGRMADIVRRVSGQAILTVSDVEAFARLGGMVAFKTYRGRVRFEINLPAAEKAGLRVSAKLLTVAQVADGAP